MIPQYFQLSPYQMKVKSAPSQIKTSTFRAHHILSLHRPFNSTNPEPRVQSHDLRDGFTNRTIINIVCIKSRIHRDSIINHLTHHFDVTIQSKQATTQRFSIHSKKKKILTAIFCDEEQPKVVGTFVHFEFLQENFNDRVCAVFGGHSDRSFCVRRDGDLAWLRGEEIKCKETYQRASKILLE